MGFVFVLDLHSLLSFLWGVFSSEGSKEIVAEKRRRKAETSDESSSASENYQKVDCAMRAKFLEARKGEWEEREEKVTEEKVRDANPKLLSFLSYCPTSAG